MSRSSKYLHTKVFSSRGPNAQNPSFKVYNEDKPNGKVAMRKLVNAYKDLVFLLALTLLSPSAFRASSASVKHKKLELTKILHGAYIDDSSLNPTACSISASSSAGSPITPTFKKPLTMVAVASSSLRPRAIRYSISSWAILPTAAS